jgi:hypothetical protein
MRAFCMRMLETWFEASGSKTAVALGAANKGPVRGAAHRGKSKLHEHDHEAADEHEADIERASKIHRFFQTRGGQ